MSNAKLAKTIRESLNRQPAYLNIPGTISYPGSRLRITYATAKRDGRLVVSLMCGERNFEVKPEHSISIYAGTTMEETFGGGKVRI